jgi:NADPH:quinone reductase-like Zn-dependent oxidoreductase
MRAVGFSTFGPAEVLEIIDRPQPVAGPGEVVVRVAASTVNPTDVLMRAGMMKTMMTELSPPFVAGNEFAGHIYNLGANVSGLAAGQAVMGAVNPRRPGGGSHAEYVSVPASSVVGIPTGADLAQAATLPMNGLTAFLVLDALALPAGSTILVTGGAGALGGYVIQLAKLWGLHVVADAKESDEGLLRTLGAKHVIPRAEGMVDGLRALYPNGVDGLIDCALLRDAAAALVKDGGVMVSVRKNIKIRDPRVQNKHISVTDQPPDHATLVRIEELWRKNTLTPRVALSLPMTEAVHAYRLVETGGQRGRIVLTF